MNTDVRVRRQLVAIPTYEPATPDRNPMFLEKRVYQGSSGRVYPLPFTNRIAEEPVDREWDVITIDNGLVEVTLLPELGGRIHGIKDLTNGYEAIYRQDVIKPALVGLSGPWASGGIEFNWPQHHRPSTFMPADVSIEHSDDGSITVWMGEHEPMDRTKGMHGVCLYPGRSVVEIKARLYNRTPYTQTFLWWSNIGTHVDENYRSFFPPDAHMVADHAKRAVSDYPLCTGIYYGVDYGARGRDGVPENERPTHFSPAHSGGTSPDYAPNDLSWYANIPVPTSYMCVHTKDDFLGGYDFGKKAGLMVVVDHHIAPGKKQWTWGNHEFGYAWDRNLTDSNGPYIELMAGVYTDNQPDFSYIAPGETKTFSQFLYPFREIGPATYANVDAAITLSPNTVSVASTRAIDGVLRLESANCQEEVTIQISPDKPVHVSFTEARRIVLSEKGAVVAECELAEVPFHPLDSATEPPTPEEVSSSDELFLIGQHLWQYRHATRTPTAYWEEALRRDPGDSRCNNAMGVWHLRRGEFEMAQSHFNKAIARMTSRNPNPSDGEPYYNLGVVLRFLGNLDESYAAFAKAAWNHAWQAASWHAMAEISSAKGDFPKAIEWLDKTLHRDQDQHRAACLRVELLRKIGQSASAKEILAADPLDHWAAKLEGHPSQMSNQVRIDIAIDLAQAGLFSEALEVIQGGDLHATDGTAPMLGYYEAFYLSKLQLPSQCAYARASQANPDFCFPCRLEDIAVLEAAPEGDARAAFYLGCLFYDRRRHHEAVENWERSVKIDPTNSVALRCLGIAAFNVKSNPDAAMNYYDRAVLADPTDSRLVHERDQLWKRLGISPAKRLAELEGKLGLILERDDLTTEFCGLLIDAGRPEEAAKLISARKFQPWEGGEGMSLGIFTRTQLALASTTDDPDKALSFLLAAENPPHNLGEARHLLANAGNLWLALGDAYAALGKEEESRIWWSKAANFQGDFQDMAIQPYSEATTYRIQALQRLDRDDEASALLSGLEAYANEQLELPAKIDYFATSLPTMLLFEDDLKIRQDNRAKLILAQVTDLRGETEQAVALLDEVLASDPNLTQAADLRQQIG